MEIQYILHKSAKKIWKFNIFYMKAPKRYGNSIFSEQRNQKDEEKQIYLNKRNKKDTRKQKLLK